MKVFIGGIMQGQRGDDQIDSQLYRVQITEAFQKCAPEIGLIDPWALNPDSVNYDEATARNTFHTMTRKVQEADMMIAYLPRMSMGTAMEMWEAYNAGIYIVAVSPYIHHWAIRFTANEILPDLDTLLGDIANGRLPQLVRQQNKNGV
jgi:nucleoside 2-deoxyribosyltransferase